jgi:hypothetical protein
LDKHFLARQSFRCWSNGNKRETNSFGVRQIHLAWDKFIWRETNSFGGRQKKTNSFRVRQNKTNSFRVRQIHFAWDKKRSWRYGTNSSSFKYDFCLQHVEGSHNDNKRHGGHDSSTLQMWRSRIRGPHQCFIAFAIWSSLRPIGISRVANHNRYRIYPHHLVAAGLSLLIDPGRGHTWVARDSWYNAYGSVCCLTREEVMIALLAINSDAMLCSVESGYIWILI